MSNFIYDLKNDPINNEFIENLTQESIMELRVQIRNLVLLENLEPVGDSEYADKLTSQSRYCARVVGDSFLHGTIVRNHLINQGIDAALAFDQPWDSNKQADWYVLTYDMPPSCLCDFSIT